MRVEERDIRKEEERDKEAEERNKNEGAGKVEDAKEVEIKSLQVQMRPCQDAWSRRFNIF